MKIKNDVTGEVSEWNGSSWQPVQSGSQNLSGTLNVLGMDTGIGLSPGVEAGLVGAGKTLSDMGSGAEKLYYQATGNDEALGQLQQEQAEQERLYSPLSEEMPWATGIGEAAPYLATAPLSGGLLAQASIGTGLGGLEYSDDQAVNAALGGTLSSLGYGIGKAAPRVLGAIRGVARATKHQKVLDAINNPMERKARNVGMELLPGEMIDNRALQQVESGLKNNPWTAGMFEGTKNKNQRVLNKLAAEAIGENGTSITDDMLGDAAERIGKVYDDIALDAKAIPLDDTKLLGIMDNISVDGEAYLNNYMRRFPEFNSGSVSGDTFVTLRNVIQKDIRSAASGSKPGVVDDLIDIQAILTDGLERVTPESVPKLRRAGQQWKNLKALESGRSISKENVNPTTVKGKLNRMDKTGMRRGRNKSDWYEALRVAETYPDVIGSPTATRMGLFDVANNPEQLLAIPAGYAYKKFGQSGGMAGLLDTASGDGRLAAGIGRAIAGEADE